MESPESTNRYICPRTVEPGKPGALIPPDQGPAVAGLRVPGDLYWVLRSPAPLAGMIFPDSHWPWQEIYGCGFSHLISLEPDNFNPAPLTKICSVRLQDLSCGNSPRQPEKELRLVREVVKAAINSLHGGCGVVVHCGGGRGRTGTVLGCVLRELGYDAATVVAYLNAVHLARNKPGWPESPWQSDVVHQWPSP